MNNEIFYYSLGLLVVEDVGDHDQGHETAVAGQDQGTEEDLGMYL